MVFSRDSASESRRPPPSLRESAIAALTWGLSVVPPKEDGTKAPDGTWKVFQSRRPTLAEIQRWYGTKGPTRRSGLGAVCGAVSGNLEVLEFDARGRVYEAFKALAAAVGLAELVARVESGYSERTPSGGIHWAYRCAQIAGNTKLAQYQSDEIDKAGKPIVKPLIETRGEGGYIVLAPSNGKVHPTGDAYELIGGGFDTIATITPEERRALFFLARSLDELPIRDGRDKAEAGARKGQGGGVSPIDDYNARAKWSEILPAGWTQVSTVGDTEYWRRPGKDRGVSATIGRGGSDRLFVFSTSAGFEAEKPYSKFAAYAFLNHGDDYKAAVKALAGAGYGTRGEAPRPKRAVDDTRPPRFHLTDLGNAERLVDRHGTDIRYCHPWQKWIVWDGKRWAIDRTAVVRRMARETIRAIYREAGDEPDPIRRAALADHARKSEDVRRINAMVKLAEAEKGIPVLPEDFNRDPWSFNVANGTIDLHTGGLRPHNRDNMITHLCDVHFDINAPCPLWLDTLGVFLHRDDRKAESELIGYLQRLCGYALVGTIEDQIMPIAYGKGANGKSTILGTLIEAFGADYAMKAAPGLLMSQRNEAHPTERADLFGKRLVVAIETEEGGRLNETTIKEATGGDRIRARRMREDFWEFSPSHTLILATNHKPTVKGTDYAIWRRLKLIPFTVTMEDTDPNVDKKMPAKLRAEFPGIIAWCVRGCRLWQAHGLNPPDEVVKATEAYKKEQDVIEQFLAECTLRNGESGLRVRAGQLYAAYKQWSEIGGLPRVITLTEFGKSIRELGFVAKESHGIWYHGLGLLDDPKPRDRDF